MGRLFVISNRVAQPGDVPTGGLANALHAMLREHRGVWMGWSGTLDDAAQAHVHIGDSIRYCTLDLPAAEFDAYYHRFANRTLWPLLHYRVDLVEYEREAYDGYLAVNRRFAETIAREVRGDDVIWVHDYHLVPLARELRSLGVSQRIGFFLHIPMPSWDVLSMMPGHDALLPQLADYDVVGLQTESDAEHLRQYFAMSGIDASRCEVKAFPIGIDADAVARTAAAAPAAQAARDLHASLGGRRLAIGVDRLDYSKGLPERFRAFERHLERRPANSDPLTYLQIAPPTREAVPEYQALRRELEGLAGHINGLHARPDWTPLRYVNHSYPHSLLTGMYRAADMALVTPMRDGMNLVAKEYVASQSPLDPGVLVLSRFAGAAAELGEALLVNPHDIDEVADAIGAAACMPRAERRERWDAMMAHLRGHGIGAWAEDFLTALRRGSAPAFKQAAMPKTLDLKTRAGMGLMPGALGVAP